QEKLILKKGSIRMKGNMPLPCDILFERDVPITLRDGVTIYTDVFRPVDDEPHPAIVALSPYGKEIGSQWLDDVPSFIGVKKSATSGLQKFEGPDPAYWVKHGYAIINPDVRGAYNSEGIILFFGSDYGRDGADIIEWTAEQSWSNGKVGMSGNSWLAISQWFVAAQHPKHLAAFAPWEGLNDCYREVATRGGVMMPEFIKMLTDSFASTEDGGVEDCISMMWKYPTMNDYWCDKAADLESITTPAYIVASYTNAIHTYGSLEGYRRISSEEKWLRIHNTGEWDDYYNPDHVDDLRKFFDKYLKGIDNGWENTPEVRLSILNPGKKDIVDRAEEDFPIPRTQYKKLYLNADNNSLQENLPTKECSNSYDSDSKNRNVSYRMKMTKDTEIIGYIKLRIWVQALDHDDMDLEVSLEKLNKRGRRFGLNPMNRIAAKGYIRASLRELDTVRSTEENPYQTFEYEQKLKQNEIVQLDILIWPMGMKFQKHEYLQITISAYKTKKVWKGPFKLKMSKISIPEEGYTYMPKSKVKMMTLGGGDMSEVAPDGENVELPKDHNYGRHVIYTGGKYDSYLYVPVIPNK
ncbi:MAG: CocE/NonD family hydrolase, partial [Intestinibacter sp.]